VNGPGQTITVQPHYSGAPAGVTPTEDIRDQVFHLGAGGHEVPGAIRSVRAPPSERAANDGRGCRYGLGLGTGVRARASLTTLPCPQIPALVLDCNDDINVHLDTEAYSAFGQKIKNFHKYVQVRERAGAGSARARRPRRPSELNAAPLLSTAGDEAARGGGAQADPDAGRDAGALRPGRQLLLRAAAEAAAGLWRAAAHVETNALRRPSGASLKAGRRRLVGLRRGARSLLPCARCCWEGLGFALCPPWRRLVRAVAQA